MLPCQARVVSGRYRKRLNGVVGLASPNGSSSACETPSQKRTATGEIDARSTSRGAMIGEDASL